MDAPSGEEVREVRLPSLSFRRNTNSSGSSSIADPARLRIGREATVDAISAQGRQEEEEQPGPRGQAGGRRFGRGLDIHTGARAVAAFDSDSVIRRDSNGQTSPGGGRGEAFNCTKQKKQ